MNSNEFSKSRANRTPLSKFLDPPLHLSDLSFSKGGFSENPAAAFKYFLDIVPKFSLK